MEVMPANETPVDAGQESISLGDPFNIACVRGAKAAVVAPASGFSHDCTVDFIKPTLVNCGRVFRSERTVVKEVSVYTVHKQQAIFSIEPQSLMQPRWAIVVVLAGNVLASASKTDFRVPTMVAPAAVGIDSASRRIKIIVPPVLVSGVKVNQHVIDEAGNIQIGL